MDQVSDIPATKINTTDLAQSFIDNEIFEAVLHHLENDFMDCEIPMWPEDRRSMAFNASVLISTAWNKMEANR